MKKIYQTPQNKVYVTQIKHHILNGSEGDPQSDSTKETDEQFSREQQSWAQDNNSMWNNEW